MSLNISSLKNILEVMICLTNEDDRQAVYFMLRVTGLFEWKRVQYKLLVQGSFQNYHGSLPMIKNIYYPFRHSSYYYASPSKIYVITHPQIF